MDKPIIVPKEASEGLDLDEILNQGAGALFVADSEVLVAAETAFQGVARMNTLFGNAAGDPLNPDWEKLSTQLGLIQEELVELSEGHESRDIKEIRDGVADVIVTAFGYAHILGINVEMDLQAVQASNMSKLCHTLPDLEATAAYYQGEIGIQVYTGGDEGNWWVKSKIDQRGGDGKFYVRGKFLKCVKWHEPKFMPLLRELGPDEYPLPGDLIQCAERAGMFMLFQGDRSQPAGAFKFPIYTRTPVHSVQPETVVSPGEAISNG